jgi:superfamily I DNA/RNA helicase
MLSGVAKKLNARSVPDFLRKVAAWENRQVTRIEAANSRNAEALVQSIQDQSATLTAVAEGATGMPEVLRRLENLFQDTRPGERPQVVLSSVHKAKGLEWDRVFVLSSTFRAGGDEESNIKYVAYTRAKSELTMIVNPGA